MAQEAKKEAISTEVKIERIPWVPIILLTVILGFFGPVYANISPNGTWYALGIIGCNIGIMVVPLFSIMIAVIVSKITRKQINAYYYTFLYAAGTGIYTVAGHYPMGSPFTNILYDRVSLAPSIYPWPSFMAPSAEVISPMLSGGAAVPWVDWIPTIIWWWLLFASTSIFAMGWGVIWRRRWIDVEKVPFPQTRVASELIDRITRSERSLKTRMGMPFIIGLILGVAFQVPLLLAYMFPWFPDIYGWRTNTCTMGTQWITPDSPLAGIVGLAQLNKDPAVGAIFYMAPLNVIFGAWFWYIIFMILMQIAFTMGYYSGITGNAGCGRVWCGTSGYEVGDPFKWDVFSTVGVGMGISLFYIIMNWRYLAETFNAAFDKLSKDKLVEFDRTEPTTYRNAYILIVGSAALTIALFMVSDVGFPASLLLVVLNLIYTLASTRAFSLVGYEVPSGEFIGTGPMRMLLGGGTAAPTREWFVSMGFLYTMTNADQAQAGFPLVSSLSSYQMASVNKVSTKSVFKILIFVCISVPLLWVVGAVWSFYTLGVLKISGISWASSWYQYSLPSSLANRPAYGSWLPYMVAGIIFVGVLSFLHARFLWFPLEPIGFLVSMDGHAMVEGIWTMALAAWIAKTITLRVGGSKLYERTGIPVAIGFIIGLVAVSIIGGMILVTRYFHPF